MAGSQIKKSTIMFTDIFGYSRMVGKDEKHALKLLDVVFLVNIILQG